MSKQVKSRTIDRNSPIPLYRQIKEILIDELKAGEIDPSRPFSTEHELVERFRVSRAPIRQALRELENEGYVYRERAKGTFPVKSLPVRPPGLELGGLLKYLREQGMESESIVLEIEKIQPVEGLRKLLELKDDERVLKVSRLILYEDIPLIWTQTYIHVPKDYNPDIEELEDGASVFVTLERDADISVTQGEHQIWATGAKEEEARTLSVEVGDPILVMETKLFNKNGTLIGWRRAVHKGDDYKYSLTVSR
ncbi:GntR family transcriptional regulator [Oceanobacillus saliphilus]|uniref:GntR family transcriptional regulator n=1 Tax=Oceanobacillus saliphilus TaxID=2925834 RepID=UPI00201DBAC3|nr:GntR family transcriptional regulator [Oceanobacillus saliphilus]